MTNAGVIRGYNYNQAGNRTGNNEGIADKIRKVMKAVLVCEDHNPHGLDPAMKARLYL